MNALPTNIYLALGNVSGTTTYGSSAVQLLLYRYSNELDQPSSCIQRRGTDIRRRSATAGDGRRTPRHSFRFQSTDCDDRHLAEVPNNPVRQCLVFSPPHALEAEARVCVATCTASFRVSVKHPVAVESPLAAGDHRPDIPFPTGTESMDSPMRWCTKDWRSSSTMRPDTGGGRTPWEYIGEYIRYFVQNTKRMA
jgi:hypothetical protein